MRKIFSIIVAISSLMATSVVQAFTVEAPKWDKLAITTTEDVNIRKEPTASSPRLLVDWEKVDNYQIPINYFAYWSSSAPQGSVNPISFTGPVPVVSEKDGWIEVLNAGPKCETNGWVNAKFCKIVRPNPITLENTEQFNNFSLIPSGPDEVYALYALCDAEMDNNATFYLGRLINGVIVAPYSLYCSSAYMDDAHSPGIFKDGDSFSFFFNSSMATDETLDLHKMPTDIFAQLLDYVTKSAHEAVIYLSEGELWLME